MKRVLCQKDLAAFLDSGLPEHAAVYASFGTHAVLLPSEIHSVARGLSALKNPVRPGTSLACLEHGLLNISSCTWV